MAVDDIDMGDPEQEEQVGGEEHELGGDEGESDEEPDDEHFEFNDVESDDSGVEPV